MCGLDAGGGTQGGLDMVLAGGTGHTKDGEREGLGGRGDHLVFQPCGVTCFGEGSKRGIDRCGGQCGAEAGGADTDFLDVKAGNGGQSLADAANAGAAVHVVDAQCEFAHDGLLYWLDDTAREKGA